MNILSIAIIIFTILEVLNVIILYFTPETKRGNGVGVFSAFEESKKYPEIHEFIRYLVYWVAGTKLIFIVLLLVILFTGSEVTKFWTCIALVFSISTFFYRLFPIIRGIDERGQIEPKGYSKGLGKIIVGFLGGFIVAIVISLIKF